MPVIRWYSTMPKENQSACQREELSVSLQLYYKGTYPISDQNIIFNFDNNIFIHLYEVITQKDIVSVTFSNIWFWTCLHGGFLSSGYGKKTSTDCITHFKNSKFSFSHLVVKYIMLEYFWSTESRRTSIAKPSLSNQLSWYTIICKLDVNWVIQIQWKHKCVICFQVTVNKLITMKVRYRWCHLKQEIYSTEIYNFEVKLLFTEKQMQYSPFGNSDSIVFPEKELNLYCLVLVKC